MRLRRYVPLLTEIPDSSRYLVRALPAAGLVWYRCRGAVLLRPWSEKPEKAQHDRDPTWWISALSYQVLLITLGFAFSIIHLRAQDDEWKVDTGLDWASKQVFRGVEWTGAAMVGAVNLQRDTFHAHMEAAHTWRSGEPGLTGLGAGYGWQLPGKGPVVGLDFQQQWLTRVPAGFTRSASEAAVKARWTLPGGWKPGLAWAHEFQRQADTLEAGMATEFALTGWGTYLETEVLAGWVSAGKVRPEAAAPRLKDSYCYGGVGLRLPYRIVATRWTVTLGARLTGTVGQNPAWSPLGRAGGAELAVTLGINREL